MKRLILTQHFFPMEGGSVNWLVNTYSQFDPDDVIFLAGHQGSDDHRIDQRLPFQAERISMHMTDWDPLVPSSLKQYIRIIFRVLKLAHQHKIQQIHCAKVLSEGFVAWCVKYIRHIPYVLYAHGEEITTALVSRKFQWLIPRIYNGSSAIIANSLNTRMILERIGVNADKIHIIHPGVNADFFSTAPDAGEEIRKQYHIRNNAPILLTVGRMQRRKGQDMVVMALSMIKEKYPDIKYMIVGSGEEYEYLKRLATQYHVADAVIFAGRVPDDELPGYYAACDIFIMPNREINGDIEGFGMVFLEANAAGKPVIGGLSGGVPEAVTDGETGLLADGTDVKSVADAILFLLQHPEKANMMGETGKRRVKNEFTWKAVAEKTRRISEMIQ